MLKFYLRTVFSLVLATVSTMLVLRLFVEDPTDELTLRLMGGHAAVHARAIAQVPPAERRAAVQKLSGALGPVHTETNRGGGAVRSEWRGADLYVLAPVPDTPGMLAFGPLPQEGIAQDLRLKIQAMSERACDLFDHLRHAVAEAVA